MGISGAFPGTQVSLVHDLHMKELAVTRGLVYPRPQLFHSPAPWRLPSAPTSTKHIAVGTWPAMFYVVGRTGAWEGGCTF